MESNKNTNVLIRFQGQAPSILPGGLQNKAYSINPTKIKPIFKNKTKWRINSHADLVYINRQKPKLLSQIEMSFMNYGEIGLSGVRKLCKALNDNTKRGSSLIVEQSWLAQHENKLYQIINSTNHWKMLKFHYAESENLKFLSEKGIKGLIRIRSCKSLSHFEIFVGCYDPAETQIFSYLSKQFKGLPKLKTLKLERVPFNSMVFYNPIKEESVDPNSIMLKVKYPASLQTLSLGFENQEFKSRPLSIFASRIQNLISLKHLDLRIKSSITSSAKSWAYIFSKMPNLQTFNLSQSFDEDQGIENVQIFTAGLSNLKNLNTLNLHISIYSHQQHATEIANAFYSCLVSFKNLKSLSIDFSYLTDPPIRQSQTFFTNLRGCIQLEEFYIKLSYPKISEDTFLLNVASSFQPLRNLKKLQLEIPCQKIILQDITFLAQTLKTLTSLEVLSLDFNPASLDSKSIEILSDSITGLPLTSFTLLETRSRDPKSFLKRLTSLWEDNKRLKPFLSAISHFSHLTSLSLDLSGFEISNKEFNHFSGVLMKMKRLRTLSLELPEFDSTNNFEGLQSFVVGFKEMKSLASLHLAFHSSKLQDKEIEHLSLGLVGCHSLEELILHFKHADQSNEESLRYLLMAIHEMLLLKNLELHFHKKKPFGEKIIVEVLKGFAVLRRLETLTLNVNISESPELYEFAKSLKDQQNFKCLTSFHLNGSIAI